jgi:proline iminopeptidase
MRWEAINPFFYGRWDGPAQEHHAAQAGQQNLEAATIYNAEGAFDPPTTRAALAAGPTSVLLLAGEVDVNSPPQAVAEYADLFPNATVVVQQGAGHFPWIDDADRFVATVAEFLNKDGEQELRTAAPQRGSRSTPGMSDAALKRGSRLQTG